MISVGQKITKNFDITNQMILQYAEITGDHNPVHVNEDFAKQSPFGKRIAHGMLTGGLISSAMTNHLNSDGCIYLSQNLRFALPVFVDDKITVDLEVTQLRLKKKIATIKTICKNQNNKIVAKGEALVLLTN